MNQSKFKKSLNEDKLLTEELEREKRQHKHWRSIAGIALSLLGSTWGALITSLVIYLLTKK